VYLDDILKLKVSKSPYAENSNSISKIGVRANNNIVQLGSLKTGYISDSYVKSYEKSSLRERYYHHYYPLSALALSKLGYNTFMDGDLSVFSKKNIILTSDPILDTKETRGKQENQIEKFVTEQEFNRYLEFAKLGGTLIVIDPDGGNQSNKSKQGAFSEFLSIHYLDESEFNRIGSTDVVANVASKFEHIDKKQPQQGEIQKEKEKEKKNEKGKIVQQERFLNISGIARNIELGNSSDTSVKSFYLNVGNNNTDKYQQEVSPFAIEKKYGEGRIIIVNIQGYFDTLFHSPEKFFQSLSVIPNLIGLENDVNKTEELHTKKEIPITRFIGNFDAIGQVLINSSSFSLVDKYLDPEHSLRGDIFFSKHKNGDGKGEDMGLKFKDALIKDLKLIGPYEVSISSNGIFHMPSRPSEYDYVVFAVLLPLDTIIKLYNGSSAEISIGNSTHYFGSNGGSEIRIHNLKLGNEGFLEALMKSPQIKVTDGKSKFSRLYSDDPLAEQLGEEIGLDEVRPDFSGAETEVIGNLSFQFDHVDHYSSSYKNGTTLMYISYLKSLKLDRTSTLVQDTDPFKVPGDLSHKAKELGMYIPLKRVVVSDVNILLLILIPITIIIIIKLGQVIKSIKHRRI
jgi:hypothetical protein